MDGKIVDLQGYKEGAIIRYISPDSYSLNDKLRKRIPLTEFEKEWIMDLNKGLEKCHVMKEN